MADKEQRVSLCCTMLSSRPCCACDCVLLLLPPLRYKKGSHPKGRNVFLKDAEPFIKWLEEAEEEEGA